MEELMSEAATELTDTGAAIVDEQGNPDDGTEALGDAGKKALDAMKAKWKDAEKTSAELKAQLDTINAANLSDLERAQKEAKDAQDAAATATAEALRLRIAAKHGISDEDADLFLTGSDAETVERQATALAARASTGPKPDLSQGAKGSTANADDPATAFANFMKQATG